MVTPGLAKLFEKAGVELIPLDSGAAALAAEVDARDDWPQVVLMSGAVPATAKPLNGSRPTPADERFDVRVSARTFPHLEGHRIQGTAVVPAVMVLDMFLQAARAHRPSLVVASCRDLRVLRGIPVDRFDAEGTLLSVRLHEVSAGTMETKLHDQQDRLRYSASVDVAASLPAPPASLPGRPADGKPWPFTSVAEAYDHVLFHRGPFATIRALGVVSETAASAEIGGTASRGGAIVPGAEWFHDVTLLDGGVQVAALWGTTLLGRLPLPTRIGAFHVYAREEAPSGPVKCFVRGKRTGQHAVIADLAFVHEDGRVLGAMEGIEFILPPTATRGPSAQAN
jgi:hypothetical protein